MYCLLLQTTQWHSIYHNQFHISCDTLHIKHEQIHWNVTNKITQYLYVFQGVIMAGLKIIQNYYSFQQVKQLLLHCIWILLFEPYKLSGTQHKYMCLYFVHSTIICSMTCQNSPAVSKTIIKATRTISFASLRINYDDIPTNKLNILIMNSLNIVKIQIFSSPVVHIYCVTLWLHANRQPNTWPLHELYEQLLEVNKAHKRMTLLVAREFSTHFWLRVWNKIKLINTPTE